MFGCVSGRDGGRWVFGGLKYTNSVEAELTPQNESKVTVQFKKFNLFGGILSFTAPDRARGELGAQCLRLCFLFFVSARGELGAQCLRLCFLFFVSARGELAAACLRLCFFLFCFPARRELGAACLGLCF